MPFRHAFRRYSASNDVHVAGIPLNESLQGWHEHAMDFTNYSPFSDASVNFKTVQDAPYLQPNRDSMSDLQQVGSPQPPRTYPTNNFGYSQVLSMDSDVPSLDASRTSSIATASTLSSSEPEMLAVDLPPSPIPEKMCPLIAGDIDSCQPSRCGPDAPCMNFTNLPPIEECTSVPCISSRTIEQGNVNSMTRQLEYPSAQDQIIHPSPSRRSVTPERNTISQPQPKAHRTNSRRQQNTNECDKSQSRLEARQRAKAAHSIVEKKYRENINTNLNLLHDTLQNARYGLKREGDNGSEFDFDAEIETSPKSTQTNLKFRKCDVLTDAMSYVNQTEVEMRHMENEIQRLNERVRMLERLVNYDGCSLSKGIVALQVQPI